MQYRQTTNIWQTIMPKVSSILLILSLLQTLVYGQYRGENLRFQGLDYANQNGVRATALGGAFTAASGEMDALFWNPAGLVGLSGIQFNLNYVASDALWRESQDYRPNRQLVTMSFILDGLRMPNPAYNGWIDSEAFLDDSTYQVNEPALGLDSYSEEAADWQRKLSDNGVNNIAAAIPFTVAGKNVTLAAGFSHRVNVMDYDRNNTHLSPHPAFDGYMDLPSRVTSPADTVQITWSQFSRIRTGALKTFSGAAGIGLTDNIHVGLRYTSLSGQTDELQSLARIGHFDLVEGIQIFKFTYDINYVDLSGTSDFSATNLTIGTTVKLGKLTLGGNLTPGYTLTREWNYLLNVSNTDSLISRENITGEDRMDIPLSYSLGLNVQPHDKFRIAFDLEHRPFSKNVVTLASEDATLRSWADQTSYRVGVEFTPVKYLSLLSGYRNLPQVFIPDGAADTQRGPEMEVYTFGASIGIPAARVDIAYEIGTLRYYDAYFSNTNFAYERTNNVRFGITLSY